MIKIGKLQMKWTNALSILLGLSALAVLLLFGFSRPGIQSLIVISAIVGVRDLMNLLANIKSDSTIDWPDEVGGLIFWSGLILMLIDQLTGPPGLLAVVLMGIGMFLRLFVLGRSQSATKAP